MSVPYCFVMITVRVKGVLLPFTHLVYPSFVLHSNNLNSSTWWRSQKPYKETKINKILTHNIAPDQYSDCVFNEERRNASNQFEAGDIVYFSLHIAHENGGTKYFNVYQPNGTLWKTWNRSGIIHNNPWWYYDWQLPSNAVSGNWRYVVTYKGQTVEHTFSVGGNNNGGGATSCNSVPTLQCGQTINSSTVNEQDNFTKSNYSNCYSNTSAFNAKDKIYKINVANTAKLTVNLSRLSKDLDLFLFDGCPSTSRCIKTSLRGGVSTEQIILDNAKGTYYIVIDGYNSEQVSAFTLSATCGTNPTPPSNCSTTTIYCGQTVNNSTLSESNTYVGSDYGSCLPSSYLFNAKDKLYKLNVTSRRNLRLKLSNLSKDLDLFLLSSCNPPSCIASSIKGGTSSEEIILNNALGTYYISVDGYLSDQVGNFRLAVECLSSLAEEEIETSKITSIVSNSNKKQLTNFSIYPNPTSNQIYIELQSTQRSSVNIDVYNTNGSLVQSNSYSLEIGENYFTENLFELSNGLYFIKINNGLETVVEKIQKL